MRTPVLLLSLALLTPAASAADPADALPASTLTYVSIDVGRAVRELPQLELVKLLEDEEVSEFLAGAFEYLKAETRQPRAALKLLQMYGLPEIIAGRVAVAVVGVGATQKEGGVRWGAGGDRQDGDRDLIADVVLVVETNGEEAFGEAVERALDLIPYERRTLSIGSGFPPQRRMTFGDPPGQLPELSYGFVGDTFVAALNFDTYNAVASAIANGGRETDALSRDPTFAAWSGACARGTGIFDVYVGARRMLDAFAPVIGQDPSMALAEQLGLTAIVGGGFSIGVADGRLRDSLAFVTEGPRTGVLGLFDVFSAGEAGAEFPGGVDLAAEARVDPGALFDGVTALLDELDPDAREGLDDAVHDLELLLEVDLREDLLAALGDRHALWLTAKAGPIPIPDGGASIALRDGERMSGLLGALLGVVAEEDPTISAKAFEVDGASAAYYLSGLPVSPTFAVVGDHLRVASSPALLKRQLAANGAGGLVADADFARCLSQNVGQGADDVAAFLYLDVANVAELGLQSVEPFLPMVATFAPFDVDSSLMPFPDTVSSYLSGYMMTMRVTDRVIALDASSPFGGLILLASAGWLGVAQSSGRVVPR